MALIPKTHRNTEMYDCPRRGDFQYQRRGTPARRFRHRRTSWGVVVCAGKRTCISQDTLRRNRRAVTFFAMPFVN